VRKQWERSLHEFQGLPTGEKKKGCLEETSAAFGVSSPTG